MRYSQRRESRPICVRCNLPVDSPLWPPLRRCKCKDCEGVYAIAFGRECPAPQRRSLADVKWRRLGHWLVTAGSAANICAHGCSGVVYIFLRINTHCGLCEEYCWTRSDACAGGLRLFRKTHYGLCEDRPLLETLTAMDHSPQAGKTDQIISWGVKKWLTTWRWQCKRDYRKSWWDVVPVGRHRFVKLVTK